MKHPLSANATETELLSAKPQIKRAQPPYFKVLLLNDDFTPMDFVTQVLEQVFHKSSNDAQAIMLQVHHQGAAECGIFTYDVAETKVDATLKLARQKEYPLQCVMEKN